MNRKSRPAIGTILILLLMVFGGVYFLIAAIVGPNGVFRQAEIKAQVIELAVELEDMQAEVRRMENLTRRLSDDYLDLDLLDQQARDVLGYIRPDEIVIR